MAFSLKCRQNGSSVVFIIFLSMLQSGLSGPSAFFRESEPILGNIGAQPSITIYTIPLQLIDKDFVQDPYFKGAKPLSQEDFMSGGQMDDSGVSNPKEDPTTKGDLFQGDILIDEERHFMLTMQANSPTRRAKLFKNTIVSQVNKWPGAIVYYTISNRFNNSERAIIANAMYQIEKVSCIQFVPKKPQSINYIKIVKGKGCSSYIGMKGSGPQEVSLAEECLYLPFIIHELLHSLGFWHEQSRSDRDKFVRVDYTNVEYGKEFNFNEYDSRMTSHQGCPYDKSSLMHYGPYAFSNRRGPTISSLDGSLEIGQKRHLSHLDIQKLNRLYCDQTAPCNDPKLSSKEQANMPVPPPPPPPLPPPPIPPKGPVSTKEKCTNKDTNCKAWAEAGECIRNPKYMKLNCSAFCDKNCPKPCVDDDPRCSEWAGSGECKSNPTYMKVYCQKSCGTCS